MHVSRTPKTALHTKRIDPDYYAPKHLADDRVLHGVGAIELGCTGRLFSGPFGSEVPNSVFVEHGVPLLRVGNVGEMQVDANDLARIPAELHRQLGASEVIPGDLLIVKASVGEKLSLVPDDMERANITQHIIGLRPNGSVDMGFAAAALFSSYGKRQLQRRALGAIIQYLGIHEARTVLIPRLKPDAQRYIGSKVRQAEVLREWARDAEMGARGVYRSQTGIFGNTDLPFQRSFRAKLSERLDPSYYEPRYASILDSGWLANCSEPLGTLIIDGSYGCLPESGSYGEGTETLLRATDLDDCNWNPAAGIRVPADQVAAKALVSEHNLLLEVKGAMTRCVVADGLSVGSYVNGTVYRFSTSIHPGYLAVHLTESIKRLYCSRESVNNIIQYLNLDAIQRLPVVRLDEAVEKEIGDGYLRSTASRGFASLLITAARLLVEALIERKVTEAELIAASKEPAADRLLLSRLAEDGLDGSGRPLFSDLDALQALLAEAKPQDPQ